MATYSIISINIKFQVRMPYAIRRKKRVGVPVILLFLGTSTSRAGPV